MINEAYEIELGHLRSELQEARSLYAMAMAKLGRIKDAYYKADNLAIVYLNELSKREIPEYMVKIGKDTAYFYRAIWKEFENDKVDL